MTLQELDLPCDTGERVITRHELQELGGSRAEELQDALELAAFANPHLNVTIEIEPATFNRIIRWSPR